jgi:hypothetical protein
MSLVLGAEQAFYWNAVSHSLLARLHNALPITLFDHGHLIRTAPAIHDRIVRWYYQGWTPPLRSHRDPLTLDAADGWAAEFRRQAGRLLVRYRRAPSPAQMIANLMESAAAPAVDAVEESLLFESLPQGKIA